MALLAATFAMAGCAGPVAEEAPPSDGVHHFASPSADERYCAWYGDARDGVLYFGQSAFWSAMRADQDDPTADLRAPGPVPIGRFDLGRREPLASLDAGTGNDRAGVWDVLAHPNGRLYFTTYFESSGYVDLTTGAAARFPDLGVGLNELALGPDGTILASRYGSSAGGDGSVVVIAEDGELLGEHPLDAPEGYLSAPKTVAYDPAREQIWVTTDLLSVAPGSPDRHDAYVLDAAGAELHRIASPEIQFVAFGADGVGYAAEVEGSELWLRRIAPPRAGLTGAGERVVERQLLDTDFATGLDFVQDIHLETDGRAVVTRWSGRVHVIGPLRQIRTVELPRVAGGGLYYSAALSGEQVCATHCGDVTVVCAPIAPPARAASPRDARPG